MRQTKNPTINQQLKQTRTTMRISEDKVRDMATMFSKIGFV